MPEHRIRLRKGWELIDLDTPEPRPERVALPLPAGWRSDRRIRLIRRFGCPALDSGSESLWLRMESVWGLGGLQINGRDIALGSLTQGTLEMRLEDLHPRNELALERFARGPGETAAWGEIAILIR